MIASKSVPAGSVPYSRPPSPPRREAQNASATAGGRVAHEQRALQAQRHAFDDAPRALLERGGVGELALELRDARVQARVGAVRLLDLVRGTPRASAASA